MAHQTTPHTESGQNQSFEESDLEPGVTAGSVGRGEDAAENDGPQTGTNRGQAHAPDGGPHHRTQPQPDTVLEGSLSTRTPEGAGQGITGRSATEESEGQKKVVAERPDAQSAVNQS